MGGGEIVLIIFVALLFFGSKAIPDIAKTLGKAMREYQKATTEMNRESNESGGGIGDDIRDIKSTVQNIKSDIQEGVRKHTSDIQEGVKETTSNIQDGINEHTSDIEKEITEVQSEVTKGAENMAKTVDNGAQI